MCKSLIGCIDKYSIFTKRTVKRAAKISLIFLASAMLLLSGITPNLMIQPASAVTSTPAPMNSLFGPRIYKSMVHVNAADKGDISPYFHRYLSNYSQNGYDSVLFNMDHDLLEITEWEPYNGGFETWTPWVKETTSSVSGSYTAEQSSARARDGTYSLHAKASVSGSTFGSAGVFQDMLWEIAPVAADLNLAFSVYPVSLKNTTKSPDSLIVVELDFNHFDSATTVPRMFLVLQDIASEPLSSGTPPFINTANDYYVVLNSQRSLTFGTWNYFNLNITDLAVRYYGPIKAYNLKIDGIHIDAYSRNKAVSEFYMDGLVLTSKDTADQIYPRLASVVKAYDTAALRMVPGEKLDLASALLYFNIDTFFQPTEGGFTGVRQTINNIHSRGDYVFISKPDESEAYRTAALNNLWLVDGISVFSTHNKHNSGFVMDIWDYYLDKGVLAMAIAEQHPMSVRDVQVSATTAPTQFVYAGDNSPATTVEAMAQGRGFVEGGYVRPMMPLFFSAEDSQVAAGKFPIYVDWSRSKASLNINLQNIPFVAKTLRVIRNGTTIDTISLQGVTAYNDNLTFSLPDKSNYFRFEVLNLDGTVVAFSNPIIYVKTEIPSDMWLALSPSLQYGSAASSISSIKYGSGTLSFTATSKDTIQVTTKIFTSKAPSIVLGAQSWKYDTNTKILSVNSKGTAKITANFNNVGILSVTTTPVNGTVFVDGSSWGKAPVSRTISNGSHTVSFGSVTNYTKPDNIPVSINVGQEVSVTGTYTLIPPTRGNLSISTTPVNGTVFVDGDSWGKAPVRKVVVTGSHTVSFGAVPNYTEPADITVSVNTNQTVSVTGTYTLIPPVINGTLSVTTTPVNGEVFVNGTSWGTAPVSKSVDPGSYTVSFGAVPNYTKPANVKASVTAEHDTSVTGTYVPITPPPPTNGTLSVTTTPVNGAILVDGVSWGTAPVSKSIAAGSHTVSFSAVSGYTKPADVTVSVTAGSNTPVTGTYTPSSPPPSGGPFTLSFQGYDYDNKEEATILVNNQVAATLPASETPKNSGVWKSFSLDITNYVVSGANTITFNETKDHSTGVKNVQITGSGGTTIYSNSTRYTLSGSGTQVTYKFSAERAPPLSDGTLLVTTTPVNGEVFVDGVSWGISPVSKLISAGSHTVSFAAVPGYTLPSSVAVLVTAGATASATGTYTLVPSPSSSQFTLRFQGYDYDNKEEATILVNNQAVATLPASDSSQSHNVFKDFSLNITKYVISGANTITFNETKDHSTGVRNVLVKGSDGTTIYSNSTYYTLTGSGTQVTYKFSATVTPTTGTLSVTTTPVNGQVVVDGVLLGTAPVSKSIAAGSHTVSFGSVSGYTAQSSFTVTVKAGQTTSVTGTYTGIPPPPPPPPPPPSEVFVAPPPPVFSPPPSGSALPAREATPPTLVLNKATYDFNDKLVVTGTASPSSAVTIKVLKPNSNILGIEQGNTDAAGAYNLTVMAWPSANSTATPFGNYTITVTDASSGGTAKSTIMFKAAAVSNTTTTTTSAQTTATVTVTRNSTLINTVTVNGTAIETATATTTATATAVSSTTVTSTTTVVSTATALVASDQVSTVVSTTVTITTLVGATMTTTVLATQAAASTTTVTSEAPTGLPAEVTYAAIGIAAIAIIAAALLATRRRR